MNAQPELVTVPEEAPKSRAYRVPHFAVRLVRDGSHPVEDRSADTPAAVLAIIRPMFDGLDREQFLAVLLNARTHVIGLNVVSLGTLSASLVHPRETFKAAILAGAAALIVAHNHPTGDPAPSPEDKDATRRLQRAGELLGIPLLDHVIVGDGARYFSFKEAGLL